MATMTSAIIAGLGAVGSAASAIKQSQLQKQAQKSAQEAAQRAKGIREQNPFNAVQVPLIGSRMAMDQVNQNAANSLSALQDVGAEGVLGGATNLNKSVRDSALDVAANQDAMKFNRDSMEADAQSGINSRKAQRDYYMEMSALQGAQEAGSDAEYNKNRAIENTISGLSAGVGEFANTDKYDYDPLGRNKKLKRKLRFKGPSDNQIQNELTPTP